MCYAYVVASLVETAVIWGGVCSNRHSLAVTVIMASGEPTPRSWHAAVGIGSKLYVWGGFSGRSKRNTKAVEVFNVPSVTWEQRPNLSRGSANVPDGLRGMAVTSDGETAYFFGGRTGGAPHVRHNTLYEVTPSQHSCQILQPSNAAPEERSNSCILLFRNKVVLHGGDTDTGNHWLTKELHVFDLKSRVWTVQPTTGKKPPPLYGHTFTKIDHHRAVVFGGSTGLCRLRDTYVLDMETWHWTKLEITGRRPPARYEHATCCIAGPLTGQQHPMLMVIGGSKDVFSSDTLCDVWLLDVDKGMWREITLPATITPRYGHSAVVFGGGASFRVVVLFGGFYVQCLSETSLLLLELKGGSWQVTRVVSPDELSRHDESLREQLSQLELSPQKVTARVVEQSLGEEQEKTTEAEKQVQPLEHKMTQLQAQKTATDDAPTLSNASTHTDGRKMEAEETDSAAATTSHTDSTCTVIKINLSDLVIKNKRLGSGRFGSVYEGYWKKGGGMRVAVKVIQTSGPATLPREIEVLQSLPPHQNIITLFGVASIQFQAYIVTELAMNGSLHDYLHTEQNKPSFDQSLNWASDIAHGMKHLHDHDIIHRDLKSQNVLLTSEWVAKLCDFGSARELGHTITTEQTGTYRWMSPEIMRKATARINKKCDLFSYGMILYELFAHTIPYADLKDNVDVLLNVTSGKRPPIPPALPSYLHDLLQRCWEDDPYRRPTFDDFVSRIVLTKTE